MALINARNSGIYTVPPDKSGKERSAKFYEK
jgi:hypothetical protein